MRGSGSRLGAVALGVLMVTMGLVGTADQAEGEHLNLCDPTDILDVAILLDASGSMGGEIDQLRTELDQLVSDLQDLGFDAAFKLVVFGWAPEGEDPIDTDGTVNEDVVTTLSTDTSEMDALLENLTANGGWEPWGDAIHILNEETAWRSGSHKVGVIATDEPVDEGRVVPGPLSRTSGTDYDGPAFYDELDEADANGIRLAAIDSSSGGLTQQQLQAAASTTDGAYTQLGHGTDAFVETVKEMILASLPHPYRMAQAAGYLQQTNVPTNPVIGLAETQAPDNQSASLPSNQSERFVDLHVEPGSGSQPSSIHAVESASRASGDAEFAQARAQANATNVSLLGGLVTAEAVHVVAQATRPDTGPGTTDTTGSFVANLTVAGESFGVMRTPASIPIPGVGTLHVLQDEQRSQDPETDPGVLIRGLHLDLDTERLDGRITVAKAQAEVGCTPQPDRLDAWSDDDAGTGGDVGDDPSTAHPVELPAVVTGRLGADGDQADAYTFPSQGPGEAISVTLNPSERTEVHSDRGLHMTPPAEPADPDLRASLAIQPLRVDLIDPNGVVQESQRTLLSEPLYMEFNGHIPGDWTVVLSRTGDLVTNYTLGLATYPLPVAEQEGTIADADTPGTCGAGPILASGAYQGALYDADYADSFRFEVEPGDEVAVGLKPSENVDGARFQIELYDGDCDLRAQGFWFSPLPEGIPRAVAQVSADEGGNWTAKIIRETEAVGNYYATLSVVNPMPAVLGPDAGNGTDANGADDPRPIETPGAYQGHLEAGDEVDCYSFPAEAGERVEVVVIPSAGMDVSASVTGPNGDTTSSDLPLTAPETIDHVVAATGDHVLCVQRDSGGGQYTFGVLTVPAT